MTTTMDTANRWAATVIHYKNAKGRARPDDQYWYRGNILFNGYTACARLEQDVQGKWWMIKLPSFYHYVYLNGPPDRYSPRLEDNLKDLVPSVVVNDLGVSHCYDGAYIMQGNDLREHILDQLEHHARDVMRLAKDLGIRALLTEDGKDDYRTTKLREAVLGMAFNHEQYRAAFAPDTPTMFDVVHDFEELLNKRRAKFLDPKQKASRFRAKARRIAIKAMGLRKAS